MNRGFTLLEILIVMAIAMLLLALGLPVGVDTYKSYVRRNERDVIVSVLARARSRSINNMYELPHGVCFDGKSYVLFRGSYISGASTNESVNANTNIPVSGLPSCSSGAIVFSQLSGTTTGATISVIQDGITSTIEISQAGRLNY